MRYLTVESHTVRRGVVLAAAVLSSAACNTNDILNVQDRAVATPQSLTSISAVPTVYAGAVGDFQAAWNGNALNDAFVPTVGLFTDEFRSSDTFTTRNDADRRTQASPANGNLSDIPYVALQKARRSTEVGAALVAKYYANDPRIAELDALAGYTYLAFGEAFCGNVPVPPTAQAEQVPAAPGIGTQALFDTAIVRFNAAIAATGNATDAASVQARNLAKVGLGRTLLDEAKYPEALAAVAGVPDNFVYKVASSSNTTREQNSLWNLNDSNKRYTVADTEGTNGLNYRSANDPRVLWRRFFDAKGSSLGFDAQKIVYEQRLYSSADADTPLADGVEAKLIRSEALLNAGNTTWLDTLNALRANVTALETGRFDAYATSTASDSVTNTTLAPLTDPGTAAARVDLLFRERAFWLFATGHRLGDLRRLIRNYGRAPESVFPTGQWWKGGPYGADVNLAIPFAEQNNPKYDPTACVTTKP